MKMIPQNGALWAAVAEYGIGTEPGSADEIITSVGLVVAWHPDPEINDADRFAVLVPVVAWTTGPLHAWDGSVAGPRIGASDPWLLAYGPTQTDALLRVADAAKTALPEWRKAQQASSGPLTGAPEGLARDAGSGRETASQTERRAP